MRKVLVKNGVILSSVKINDSSVVNEVINHNIDNGDIEEIDCWCGLFHIKIKRHKGGHSSITREIVY